ncbi:MAG: hypothetical protein N3D75_04365 [Candidatus Aenigmarchaeota archaeon]|nr:hypothetical protein [Candidatus Aenigmarchaeota archaeon]
MKKAVFLMLFAILGIAISQNMSQDYNLTLYVQNQSINFSGLVLDIYDENNSIIFSNLTDYYSFNISPGNYYLVFYNLTDIINSTYIRVIEMDVNRSFYVSNSTENNLDESNLTGDDKVLYVFLEKKHYSNIPFYINISGSDNTNFSLSVNKDGSSIFALYASTNENGSFVVNLNLSEGIYTVVLDYLNKTVSENFEIIKKESEAKVEIQDNYVENVSLKVYADPETDVALKFDSLNLSKVYFAKTNQNGFYIFNELFEPGSYTFSLYLTDERVFEANFTVEKEKHIQGDIVLDNDVLSEDTAFTITGFNTTMDCKHYSIKAAKFGIIVKDAKDIKIVNCNVLDAEVALMVKNSENVIIEGLNAKNNKNGLVIVSSRYVNVISSDLRGNEFFGSLVYKSEDVVFEQTETETRTNIEFLASLN